MEYLINDQAYPVERAITYVRSARRASFYVFCEFKLPSDEDGKVYPFYETVKVTADEALKLLGRFKDFSGRKREAGQNGVRGVPFSVSQGESGYKTIHIG